MNLRINDIIKNDDVTINCDDIKEKINDYLTEDKIEFSRKDKEELNEKINETLKRFVIEGNLESEKCYFVKNIITATNMVYVQEHTKTDKNHKNIDKGQFPENIKIGDILIIKNGKLIINDEMTCKIKKIEEDAIEKIKDKRKLFKDEKREYIVCGKSDDDIESKMNLRIEETQDELWGIKISKELYEKIKYGSKIRFINGEYICGEEKTIN